MKNKSIVLAALVSGLLLTGCNDDFLEKAPLDSPTAETAFVNYDNFKAYAWGLYETFPKPDYNTENATDNISYNSSPGTGEDAWIKGTKTVPDSRSGEAWNYYSYIRKVNLMLDHINSSELTDADKEHWRSVGYFFRSYRYFTLLSNYGGVPWIDHVLSDTETDIVFGPRATRDEVANHILADLQYAEKNIRQDGDGANTINKAVVQALLSRFTLFEGTWRKYHGLQDSEKFLKECVRVSAELVKAHPNVCEVYDDLFCSLDLSSNPSVLLFKQYSDAAGVVHATSIGGTVNNWWYNPTHDFVASFLCNDGKPVATSPLFQGDKNLYQEFANRDRRLWTQVVPPYRVDRTGASDAWSPVWKYTEDPHDRAYIDSLAEKLGLGLGTARERQKTLPFRQGFEGGVLGVIPHWSFYTEGTPWARSPFGYYPWKFYCCHLAMGAQRNEEVDYPIFRIEEVMLNYAEAACELDQFNQDVADATINKLRPRAAVAPLKIGDITESFDPARDPSVKPLLWEVRRERRVELFLEGFRFDDLRRWHKCDYAMKQKVGMWVNKTDPTVGPNGYDVLGGGQEGYITFHPAPTNTWPEYYYLYPIPRNEIVLNSKLDQNPGWE